MFTTNKYMNYINSGLIKLNNIRYVSSKNEKINFNRVCILSKMTRYDYERMKFKELDEKQFELCLRNRGTNFDKMKYHDELQKNSVKTIAKILKVLGSEVEIVNRLSYTKDVVSWADCVIPTGGDGTFLLAASLVKDNDKPVIGINTDPNRSEGFLCLPKKYSTDLPQAFNKIRAGQFRYTFRNRIRSKIVGATKMTPRLLHQLPCDDLDRIIGNEWEAVDSNGGKTLPVLALNEVFIGETLSARVSHLELNFDDASHFTNTKCSGVLICTGTGSTSWHYSINRLSVQAVAGILRILDYAPTEEKSSLATLFAELYNNNLKFPSDDLRMGYSVREIISAGVWPNPKGLKARGFIKKAAVKSNCDDAYIVVDGGLSFSFNDGAMAVFEIHPEDALRTIILD